MSKVNLKIWIDHGVKKIREAPKTMAALSELVAANVQDKTIETKIWYQDESKDWITISDDDDLQLAYECSLEHFKGDLKIYVKPVAKKEKEPITKNTGSTAGTTKQDDAVSDSVSSEDDDDNFNLMKSMIQQTIKKQTTKMMESFSDIKFDEESNQNTANDEYSDQIPSKIEYSSARTTQDTAVDVLNESVYPNEVHARVECDGCGVAPILGVRYKCSVCKNFDFCEKCEDSKDHPHAFLKIKRAQDAPKVMMTTIDDAMEGSQADIEIQDANLLQQFFGSTANTSMQPQNAHHPPPHPHPFFRGHHGPRRHHGHHGHHGPPHHGPPHHGPPPHHFPPPPSDQIPSGGPGPFGPHQNGFPDEFAQKMQFFGKCFGDKMKQWAQGQNWDKMGKDWSKNCGWAAGGGDWPKRGGCPWKQGGCGGGGHKMNRCRVVKKPEEAVVGAPGETVFIEAEFRNNTHWPYKPGTILRNFFSDGAAVIEDVIIPVADIQGMSNFPMNIPIKIKDNAAPKEYELLFGMHGPRGWAMGETLSVKLKVVDKAAKQDEQMMIYIKASAFMCKYPESKFTMVECLDAFRAVGEQGEDKVLQFIQKKRQEEAIAFAEEKAKQNESIFKDDADDDLYN